MFVSSPAVVFSLSGVSTVGPGIPERSENVLTPLCVVSAGAGSVLPHGDAGPFPVSVAGATEGAARGSVLPGRGPGPGSGALRQRPGPELRPGASDRAGGGVALVERCSSGMQPGSSSLARAGEMWDLSRLCASSSPLVCTFLRNTSCL